MRPNNEAPTAHSGSQNAPLAPGYVTAKECIAETYVHTMSYDEIHQLYCDINELPGDKLCRVIEIIQQSGRSHRDCNLDEMTIDLETLQPPFLRELEQYIASVSQKTKTGVHKYVKKGGAGRAPTKAREESIKMREEELENRPRRMSGRQTVNTIRCQPLSGSKKSEFV